MRGRVDAELSVIIPVNVGRCVGLERAGGVVGTLSALDIWQHMALCFGAS